MPPLLLSPASRTLLLFSSLSLSTALNNFSPGGKVLAFMDFDLPVFRGTPCRFARDLFFPPPDPYTCGTFSVLAAKTKRLRFFFTRPFWTLLFAANFFSIDVSLPET